MRIAAIILNLTLIVATIVLFIDNGLPSPDDGWFFVYFLLLIVTPVLTVFSLFLSKSESWLSLFFKRKAAEERQRISQIEKQRASQPQD